MDNHPLMKLLLNLEFYKAEVPKQTMIGRTPHRYLAEYNLSVCQRTELCKDSPVVREPMFKGVLLWRKMGM